MLVLVILVILFILHWVAINCYNCSELPQCLTISLTIVYNVTKYAKVLLEIVGKLLAIVYTKSKCCGIAALPLLLAGCCCLRALAPYLHYTSCSHSHGDYQCLESVHARTTALRMGALIRTPAASAASVASAASSVIITGTHLPIIQSNCSIRCQVDLGDLLLEDSHQEREQGWTSSLCGSLRG